MSIPIGIIALEVSCVVYLGALWRIFLLFLLWIFWVTKCKQIMQDASSYSSSTWCNSLRTHCYEDHAHLFSKTVQNIVLSLLQLVGCYWSSSTNRSSACYCVIHPWKEHHQLILLDYCSSPSSSWACLLSSCQCLSLPLSSCLSLSGYHTCCFCCCHHPCSHCSVTHKYLHVTGERSSSNLIPSVYTLNQWRGFDRFNFLVNQTCLE